MADTTDRTGSERGRRAPEVEVSSEEVADLHRDMRTARAVAWLQEHQTSLIIAGAALIVVLAGVTLWMNQAESRRVAAATLYHQALATDDTAQKRELMASVARDYDGTAYEALAHLRLAALDGDRAESHLKAVLAADLPPELGWQARLDLAGRYLRQGARERAASLLAERTGGHYEQLRLYLLSRTVDSDERRAELLRKSLEAESHDEALERRVERELKSLTANS